MNPQSSDWNHFWTSRSQGHLKGASWSKRRIIRVIEPFLKNKNNILEAGCGSGFFSKYFCDLGFNTFSLDYSDKALKITRDLTKGRSKILKYDLLITPLAEKITQRFDVVFSDGLLEHFNRQEQNQILQNLKSVLISDGILMTFVPNRWSPWELIRPIFMPGIGETPFVLSRLIALHRQNDFAVLSAGGINTIPVPFSPDRLLGKYFGMLLYAIAQNDQRCYPSL